MKKLILTLCLTSLLFGCNSDDDSKSAIKPDYFAVANRGSGTVTIYNQDATQLVKTLTLSDENAAPTYVVYSKKRDLLYVADFNNSKIVMYNLEDFTEHGSINTNKGSFHMWLNDNTNQLWVNNIQAKTTSVIHLGTNKVLNTLPLPNDLDTATDAAQHDAIISPDGKYAFISIFSKTGKNYVVQYNAATQTKLKSMKVAGDPHLSIANNKLYILTQEDGNIKEVNIDSFNPTSKEGKVTNAHGVAVGKNNTLYVTNIAERIVHEYNTTETKSTKNHATTATTGVAHNLAYNPYNHILGLTISGGKNVEFFTANANTLATLKTFESGENPFGIVYIER